jgi:hypothetical protein
LVIPLKINVLGQPGRSSAQKNRLEVELQQVIWAANAPCFSENPRDFCHESRVSAMEHASYSFNHRIALQGCGTATVGTPPSIPSSQLGSGRD